MTATVVCGCWAHELKALVDVLATGLCLVDGILHVKQYLILSDTFRTARHETAPF
jgi:hypothetical protein